MIGIHYLEDGYIRIHEIEFVIPALQKMHPIIVNSPGRPFSAFYNHSVCVWIPDQMPIDIYRRFCCTFNEIFSMKFKARAVRSILSQLGFARAKSIVGIGRTGRS